MAQKPSQHFYVHHIMFEKKKLTLPAGRNKKGQRLWQQLGSPDITVQGDGTMLAHLEGHG